MTSRNKREGWYIGEIYGKHYRSKSKKHKKLGKYFALDIKLARLGMPLDLRKVWSCGW